MTYQRKHGHAKTPSGPSRTYRSWREMKQRCLNVTCKGYPRYGGRGITVCERWLDFENFLADMGERPEGTSLDRVNNDGGYELSNCRWATPAQQSRNKSGIRLLTFQGRTMCVGDWAKELGVWPSSITQRIEYGWPLERALTTPRPPYRTGGE